MTPLLLRSKRTLLAGAALWLVLAGPGRAAAGEAYYLLVFGSQRIPNNPNYSHSFATFVRAAWPGDGPCLSAAGLILEARTISWLPRTGRVRTLALSPDDEASDMTAGPLRVLVVDDNPDCADSTCHLVKLWGHHPLVAYDAAAALGAARAERPDVVLLDLGLPGMDGWELARRLRDEPGMPGALLVAVSGLTQPADRAKSYEAGIDCHLAKPVDPEALGKMLAEYAARR